MGKIDIYNRINYLVETLNYYTKLYDEGHPAITDKEWDSLYFELVNLEKIQPQFIRKDSPTQVVSYQVMNKLEKRTHSHPMLSLAKTKSLDEVKAFIEKTECIAMLKLDGLTCSLRYEGGRLVSAETRGDGKIGEDVTHNALVVKNIPKRIEYTDNLVVDGEIICFYDDFEPFSQEYKNPRNFASGSIRLLDSRECERRHLSFIAWDCIEPKKAYLSDELTFLESLGFYIVPYLGINTSNYQTIIDKLQNEYKNYPIDGVVIKYDNTNHYESLGKTAHHFNGGIAYKFYNDLYDTTLKNIEWTMGRTGVLTPVAVFEPVEIDGTIVERASLHNVSIMKEILGKAYIGQKIKIFKANQIIPQIAEAEKE